mmetsp:Transcript_2191/g.3863  ORF Transcript_2191/g.3863 Transcript_2191/m.3863 type:complete len:137 (+) Transcript_2191:193-603(+)
MEQDNATHPQANLLQENARDPLNEIVQTPSAIVNPVSDNDEVLLVSETPANLRDLCRASKPSEDENIPRKGLHAVHTFFHSSTTRRINKFFPIQDTREREGHENSTAVLKNRWICMAYIAENCRQTVQPGNFECLF